MSDIVKAKNQEAKDFFHLCHLFRSEAIWQAFFLHTLDCVLDVDFETQEMRCSIPLAQSLRLTPEALPRTLEQWLELCHTDDYAKNLEFNRRAFEGTENAFSLERKLYCGDGVYRQFRMNAVCIRNEKGKLTRLIAVETNISDQKRTDPGLTKRLHALENEISMLKKENARLTSRFTQKILREETLDIRMRQIAHMADATGDLLFYCDAAGRLLACNNAFSSAAAHNPDLTEWVSELVRAGHTEAKRRCYDAYGRARDLLIEIRGVSICSDEEGYAGVAHDITELEETRADMDRLKLLFGRRSFSLANEAVTHEAGEFSSGETDEIDAGAASLNSALETRLQRAVKSLSSVSELFPTRAAQLENLLKASSGTELEVGVVGITSSGKSAFINAMMGEKLLPEETRATSNLVVRCRKGKERSVTVITKDDKRKIISGPDLTAVWMEGIASERLNQKNEQNVAFLEWTSPGAALPEGLVLLDTPGLDACDLPEHSELVLRRLLPNLDIVLYVTSIRNRFKPADLELLEAAIEYDQRVIFLLSQIDLEQDDMEGGKIVLSRRQKLYSYVSGLYRDIDDNFAEDSYLRQASVVAVSSKLAAARFYDRESEEWRASNFGALIGQLEVFRSNLHRCKFETRARRALVLLSRAASDIDLAVGKLSTDKVKAEEAARLEKIKELRDAQRWANAEISAVRNEWRRQLDPEYHLKRLKKEIEAANTVKGVKDRYERWDEEWAELVALMTNRMDRARRSCREMLSKHGISSDDRAAGTISVKSELPEFYRYVVNEAQEVQVRGWFESLEFWPRYSVFFRQDVDKNKMAEGAKELITERLRLLNDHLSWWENRMREDYCDLLYGELSREDVALADTRRAAADVSVSRKTLLKVLRNVREESRGVKSALNNLFVADSSMPDSLNAGFGRADCESALDTVPVSGDPGGISDISAYGLFAPLLASLQEQNIQSRFMGLDALRRRKRVVFLGLRRHDSLRLLSRLVHDAAFFDAMETEEGREIGERDWIFRGSIPPALPHVKVSLPDTLLRDVDILIAPSDSVCAFGPDASSNDDFFVDWNDIFAEWLPIVHIDMARIDSGLSDLARAPYASALAHADHWVAASGQGALFNARLSDLLTDVPERLSTFTARRGYKGRMDWFVYENYDARYTDFLLLGQSADWGSGGEFLHRWQSEGHDFKFPFSEFQMRLAIEGAKKKRPAFADFKT